MTAHAACNDNPDGELLPQELLNIWHEYLLVWRIWAYQIRLWPPVKDWDDFHHRHVELRRLKFRDLCKMHRLGLRKVIAQLGGRAHWNTWQGAAMSDLVDRRQGCKRQS
jgi:hypothetical protein